jgi:hypothetical protein
MFINPLTTIHKPNSQKILLILNNFPIQILTHPQLSSFLNHILILNHPQPNPDPSSTILFPQPNPDDPKSTLIQQPNPQPFSTKSWPIHNPQPSSFFIPQPNPDYPQPNPQPTSTMYILIIWNPQPSLFSCHPYSSTKSWLATT